MNANIKKAGLVFIGLLLVIIIIGQFYPGKSPDEKAVSVVSERVLIPGGQSIGVRMDVKGVLIVGLEEIERLDGEKVNPGLAGGLQIGDSILEINGQKVYKASEVKKIINRIKDKVRVKVQRKDRVFNLKLEPVADKTDKLYKLGIWVKDKTAGIGTLSYYNPVTKTFGALGHPIVDPETNAVLPVNKGELLQAQVLSIKEGSSGTPGEIRGIFYDDGDPLGILVNNCKFGIFGNAYHPIENPIYEKPLVAGTQEQIKKGPAYILTTIENDQVEKFKIEIERINKQRSPGDKGMIIKVTDKKLLEKCGGIIQGMSGSPIIQNDRIIGAVTHVFVNNPKKGYGVFIEWMLDQGKS